VHTFTANSAIGLVKAKPKSPARGSWSWTAHPNSAVRQCKLRVKQYLTLNP